MKKTSILFTLVAVALVISAVLVGACGGSSAPTQAPSGTTTLDGAQLMDTRCSVCHNVSKVTSAKYTADQWDQTVTRMIGKGAQLDDAEKAALVKYLAEKYGP